MFPRKYGIAGFGFVGQAMYSAIKVKADWIIYDRYKPRHSETLDELKKTEATFCCLPTPMSDSSGEQDFSAYEWFFEQMAGYDGVFIVKSTVIYENIAPFMGKFKIVLNPEFLCQNSAVRDFKNQHVVILGGEADLCRTAMGVYGRLDIPETAQFEYCTAEQACQFKYLHNIYHAYKILFWNYVWEMTGNSRKIFSLYSALTGNTNEMAQIAADGELGYGGACFPKDIGAFAFEHPHMLTTFMQEYNKRLRE